MTDYVITFDISQNLISVFQMQANVKCVSSFQRAKVTKIFSFCFSAKIQSNVHSYIIGIGRHPLFCGELRDTAQPQRQTLSQPPAIYVVIVYVHSSQRETPQLYECMNECMFFDRHIHVQVYVPYFPKVGKRGTYSEKAVVVGDGVGVKGWGQRLKNKTCDIKKQK